MQTRADIEGRSDRTLKLSCIWFSSSHFIASESLPGVPAEVVRQLMLLEYKCSWDHLNFRCLGLWNLQGRGMRVSMLFSSNVLLHYCKIGSQAGRTHSEFLWGVLKFKMIMWFDKMIECWHYSQVRGIHFGIKWRRKAHIRLRLDAHWARKTVGVKAFKSEADVCCTSRGFKTILF